MNNNSINENFQKLFSDVRSNPYIIPLPEKSADDNIKYIKYIVDSRDRNISQFPSPSKYEVDLLQNILNVTSLELMLADVPFSRYLIHDNNNTLHYNDGSEISIENGDYEFDVLNIIFALNNQLNGINVTLNTNTNKVTFSSGTIFSLEFKGDTVSYSQSKTDVLMKKKSIGRILGFDINDYAAVNEGGTFKIVSPYPVLVNTENYIIMKLSRAKIYAANNKPADDCFAVLNNISSREPTNNYVTSVIKKFNPPLSSYEKLNISFYDYYGNAYDFNNRDHHFELKFGVLREGRRLQN